MEFIDADVIENAYIEIQDDTVDFEVLEENEQFGILNLKVKKTEITKTPTLFLFTIDKTGSMNEKLSG